MSTKHLHRYLACGLLLLCAFSAASHAAEFNLWDPNNPLIIYGFIHSEHSWTDATGNEANLRDGLFRWDTDYNHELKGSVLLDGHLSESLTLNGSLIYDSRYADDPNRVWDRTYWDHFRMKLDLDTARPFWGRWSLNGSAKLSRDPNWRNRYPDSRLLLEPVEELRLEAGLELSGPWANIRAGDVQSTLGSNDLTLYERNAFGLHGELFGDDSELHFVGARSKGEVFFQTPTDSLGIRADGTSGPYRLRHAPIVRGSETVWIEVRDRFDPTIVLERIPQRRLIDYTIDYVRGVLVFMEPVQSENFDDDPIYIASQYSYDSRNTGFERWLGATRGETRLGDKLTVGATYAGEFDERGTWKGTDEAPSPLRHHAYGLDASLQLAEQTEIHASYALSDTGSWGQGDNNSALQVGLSSRSVERLRLDGDYQRLERKFDPITNRFLVGQRDKERWNAKAEIDVSSEVVARAENRASRDISQGSDGERLTDMSQILGATWNMETYPTLDAEFEVRDIYDGPERSVQNDRRSTGRLTASHGWGRLDWRARYENERYDEKVRVNGEHETIHRLKADPKLYLGQGLTISGEGKVETHFDRETDRYDERRSFIKGRAEYQVSEAFSALGSWERRDTHDTDRQGFSLGGGKHRDSDLGYSLGANWKPTHNFETRSRVERQRGRDELLNEDNRRTQSYRQQAFWYISRDFEVSGEFIHTDLEDLRKIGVSGDGDRRIDNEFLADVSYNHKEDLSLTAGVHFHKRDLYTAIVSETWVRRVFLGGNIHLTKRLELTGEGYYAWLEGEPLAYEEEGREIENARLRFLLELAYDFRSHTRFAFGIEGVDYEEDSAPENANDFSATRAYLKLIGRF